MADLKDFDMAHYVADEVWYSPSTPDSRGILTFQTKEMHSVRIYLPYRVEAALKEKLRDS